MFAKLQAHNKKEVNTQLWAGGRGYCQQINTSTKSLWVHLTQLWLIDFYAYKSPTHLSKAELTLLPHINTSGGDKACVLLSECAQKGRTSSQAVYQPTWLITLWLWCWLNGLNVFLWLPVWACFLHLHLGRCRKNLKCFLTCVLCELEYAMWMV